MTPKETNWFQEQTPEAIDAIVEGLLKGAVDLHCHSGPSVMPRNLDHIEAIEDAGAAGFKALLIKDHYFSATPITELLAPHYQHLGLRLLSGVALNNTVGGFNPYAVDHTIKLGGKIVWMPTFSSANHLDHEKQHVDFEKVFPPTKERMLPPTPLRVLDPSGKLLDEVKVILDLIAQRSDVVLSSGHLHISEIWPLFEEAKARGVNRLLVNHPTAIVDASLDDIRRLVNMGAFVEHSICLFIEESVYKRFDIADLPALITAGTVERTILGSDLGQAINPVRPVDGFRSVIRSCLEFGYSQADIRKMVSTNASKLFGLPLEE